MKTLSFDLINLSMESIIMQIESIILDKNEVLDFLVKDRC